MKPEGSLLNSQQPATCVCPEPNRSTPYPPPIPLLYNPFWWYPPIYSSVFQVVSFPQVSPLTPCIHLSCPPYVLHGMNLNTVKFSNFRTQNYIDSIHIQDGYKLVIPAFEPPKSPDTVAGSHVIINHVRQGVSLLNNKTSGNVLSSVTHKCAVSCLRACHYDTSNWFHAE